MRFIVTVIFASITIVSCTKTQPERTTITLEKPIVIARDSINKIPEDVPVINPFKTHKLTLLITNNVNTFFLYKGESLGLEFELLRLFLKEKKISLEIKLIDDMEHIRDSLHATGAHMAAGTFIIPDEPMPNVLYSKPIYTTDLLLVKHKDHTAAVTSPSVIRNAPYVKYLWDNNKNIEGLTPIYVSDLTTKELLLKQVHFKEIESTIADANEVALMQAIYPDIVVEKVLAKNAPVGFMFHPKMDTLRIIYNKWLVKHKHTTDYRWIIKKYESLPQSISNLLKVAPIEEYTSKLSLYDELIKKHAEGIGWDWRLVASLIHQESHFNPKLRSWVGACGLMQVMPHTASVYGHVYGKNIFVPKSNIVAGTSYIRWLEKNFFKDSSIAFIERQKFIVASYNAGPGHIEDARALCVKYKLNPNIWEGNVEKMILAKSYPKYYRDAVCKYGYCRGYETSTYVKNIFNYYGRYSYYFNQ